MKLGTRLERSVFNGNLPRSLMPEVNASRRSRINLRVGLKLLTVIERVFTGI